MNELISIIVPVYNVPSNMLKQCLNSLKKIKYANFEVIVVDDGSNKLTASLCDKFLDKNIKIYHKKNGGLCDTRNYGVSKASGEWICFVDGDDYIDTDIFNRVFAYDIDNDIDVINFGTIKKYQNDSFKYDYTNYFENNAVYTDNLEIIKKLLDFNSGIGDVTAKLYRRKFLMENSIYHNKEIKQGVEAIDFNFRCFEKLNKFLFIKEYGYYYVYNDKSITFTMNNQSMTLLLKGIDCLYENKENSKFNDEITDVLDLRIQYVVATTLISGIFAPNNKLTKIEQEKFVEKLLENKNINKALSNKKVKIEPKRRLTIFMMKTKFFLGIKLIAYLRKKQKQS